MTYVLWTEENKQTVRDLTAQGKTCKEIALAMDRSERSVSHIREKLGITRSVTNRSSYHAQRAMPDGFREWAPGKSILEIRKHYKVAYNSALRWRNECGFGAVSPARIPEPVPGDFREVASTLSVSAACAHYKRHWRTVTRWFAESKITPAKPPRTVRTGVVRSYNVRQPISFGTSDGSIAAMAANHLRRSGFSNVYRATVLEIAKRKHLADNGRDYYVVAGRGLLHQSDMIAIAEACGFQMAA